MWKAAGENRTRELQPRENAVYSAMKVGVLWKRDKRTLHVTDGFQSKSATFGIIPDVHVNGGVD